MLNPSVMLNTRECPAPHYPATTLEDKSVIFHVIELEELEYVQEGIESWYNVNPVYPEGGVLVCAYPATMHELNEVSAKFRFTNVCVKENSCAIDMS